jgi:hypothetical protein
MAGIDRRKHHIDVMERVIAPLREGLDGELDVEVSHESMPPESADAGSGAIRAAAGTPRETGEPRPPRTPRGDDEYESDRRGEHTYPDDGTPSPPSHKQRNDLKSRLERRG